MCFKRPSVPSSYISKDTYLWVLIETSSVDVWGKSVLLFVMIWVKANKTEALVPMYAAVFYRSLDRNSAYLDTPKIYLVTPKIYLVSPKTDSVHQQIFGYANNIFRYAKNICFHQKYISLCQKYIWLNKKITWMHQQYIWSYAARTLVFSKYWTRKKYGQV